MTYNSLLKQILSYFNRNDQSTIDQIPNFIYQAEQRIARESKNIGLEVYVIGSLTPTNPVLQKPSRWRRNLAFSIGTGDNLDQITQLYLRSYEFVRRVGKNGTETGQPLFYADYGYSNLIVSPTPDLAYPFEYCYLQLPETLTINNQTNWLTQYAPDVLLYASLLEGISFLKNDERIPVWEAYYKRGIDSLNSQDDQRKLDRSSNIQAD